MERLVTFFYLRVGDIQSKVKKRICVTVAFATLFSINTTAFADADVTTYPVVFAHGMAGFDDLLGYDYWGDDYGNFVGDGCGFLELGCNEHVSNSQKAYIAQVYAFHNSDVRGLQLADDCESAMAAYGASQVNIIGHSHGGLDLRKAAKVLRERYGQRKVRVVFSVSSPHRGSPVAHYVASLPGGIVEVLDWLVTLYGNIVYESGNDGIAGAYQLIYNDFDPNDGVTTGAKAFNNANPISSSYAAYYRSMMTAQNGLDMNPLMYIASEGIYDIDGDGTCTAQSGGDLKDCNNDGAAGSGDGNPNERDDDGLVGINSQQMGYRCRYDENFGLDDIDRCGDLGYVSDINNPNTSQQSSKTHVINQDHLDVVGVPPDFFDENEFYAAIFDYIASKD